jgi:hypothetical protein
MRLEAWLEQYYTSLASRKPWVQTPVPGEIKGRKEERGKGMEGKKLNTLSCDPAIPSPAIYSELKKKIHVETKSYT